MHPVVPGFIVHSGVRERQQQRSRSSDRQSGSGAA